MMYMYNVVNTHGKVCTFQKSRRNCGPSILYLQPPISPLFPRPFPHIFLSIYLSVLFLFVGEDIISMFSVSVHGNGLSTLYYVIGLAQFVMYRLQHTLKT